MDALALAIALCFALFPGAGAFAQLSSGKADSSGWTVLFRADNPLLWDTDAGDPSLRNGFALHTAKAPADMRFLKLTRTDNGETIIIGLPFARLTRAFGLDSGIYWDGGENSTSADGDTVRMLGIARRGWAAATKDELMVMHETGKRTVGFRGWGFSTPAGDQPRQTYSWAGDPIDKTIFEIAVKSGDLTSSEKSKMLTEKAGENPPAESVVSAAGPTTRLTRLQSTIKALSVTHMPSGEMLGDCEDFILTATPGTPKGDAIPLTFTSAVGPQSQMVLNDVARAINAKYPHVNASKFELSFEEKLVEHEGTSIGAACGTLMLSIIENFEIDPKLAITGDVAANGKLHPIGGIAAKIRGATNAGCKIVAVPAENYDQVVDAFVYEGPGLLINMQVIGIENLDDAAALARTDRQPKLKQAIALFADVQRMLKSTPDRIHEPETLDRLNHVLELAPNHMSAKLLLLLGGNEQPKKLSGGATNYYADVAVLTMLPSLFDRKPNLTLGSPAVVQEGLKKIQKLRWYANPQFLPYVNAVQDLMLAMKDAQGQRIPPAVLKAKAQAVLDERDKLDINRDLMEKMQHEGI
jgi:hypothetical protein